VKSHKTIPQTPFKSKKPKKRKKIEEETSRLNHLAAADKPKRNANSQKKNRPKDRSRKTYRVDSHEVEKVLDKLGQMEIEG
jgi:hypothetical protein